MVPQIPSHLTNKLWQRDTDDHLLFSMTITWEDSALSALLDSDSELVLPKVVHLLAHPNTATWLTQGR